MQVHRRLTLLLSVATVALLVPLGSAVGAAGYDLSNPSSTKCVSKGLVEYPVTTRTYGVWQIRLRRSTGCNTVWAVATRTDTKKCQSGGKYCAKIRITRVRSDGTKLATAWRKTPVGSKSVYSLQLTGLNSSVFLGDLATFGGTKIGTAGVISISASGGWTAV